MTKQTTHKVNYINDIQDGNNIYKNNNTLYSCVNTTLGNNSQEENITLLNYNDYIIDNNGYKIYGHPEKWQLDYIQQYSNCGVEAVMNISAINGSIDITDETWTEQAFSYNALSQGLCIVHRFGGVKRNPTSKTKRISTELKKVA